MIPQATGLITTFLDRLKTAEVNSGETSGSKSVPMAQPVSAGMGRPVMNRITPTRVFFARPFSLAGLDGPQPAGTYTIETEEELLEGLSFPAYRRIGTVMLLPAKRGSMVTGQAVAVDPVELDAVVQKANTGSEQVRDDDDEAGSPVGRTNALSP